MVPGMGRKKKAASAKSWTLAGEPVYSSPLAPPEERVFKEAISSLRSAAIQMREVSPRFSQGGAMKKGEQAARASLGYFFKYFDGKYRREDIAEALAKAAALPGPVADHCNSSCCYMLGAALWLLDYVEREELWDELVPLLPPELDDEIDFATPAVDDLAYPRDHMLGLMAVFMERKGKQRQVFRKIWSLVDPETAGGLKNAFKAVLLDYFDRYLEVCSRVNPSAGSDSGEASPLLSPPAFCDSLGMNVFDDLPDFNPARDHADLWFLMYTTLLIGKSSEEVRETLYFRRSSELLLGFRVDDPYAICAAYLLLERDGDVLANLNMLTVNVLICAERYLPWGADEAYSYAEPYGNGRPDLSLRYAYHPHENAEEEDLPDPDIEEGELLSEGQLFYLATGYALPRNQAYSSRLKGWFQEQGVPEGRAEALAWGAWFASYVDDLRTQRPMPLDVPDDFEDFLKSLDEELTGLVEEASAEEADSTAKTAELTHQLKESRKALHEAEQGMRQLQERLRSVEADALRDRAELSQLRETLFDLRAREGQPEDEAEAAIAFPYQTKRRIVAFGGHDTWRKAIRPMLPDVRFFDREMLPDVNVIKSADVVWIQANAISHKFYYRIIDTARKENISVRYFGSASARKCAEQLAADELAAAE